MKTILALCLMLGVVLSVTAQTHIKAEASLVTHPAKVMITPQAWERGSLQKQPQFTITPIEVPRHRQGAMTISKSTEVNWLPSGGPPTDAANWTRKVEIGCELQLEVNEHPDAVHFSAILTIREKGRVGKSGDVAIVPVTAQEYYLGGTAQSGQTLILPLKTLEQGKRLTLVLKITKV